MLSRCQFRRPASPGTRHAGALALALALCGGLRTAAAQSTATFDPSVYVRQPLQITGDRPLTFNKVRFGQDATVAYNDPANNGGQFTILGSACTDARLRFVLPTTLTSTTSSGTASLPIDSWVAEYTNGTGYQEVWQPDEWDYWVTFDHSGKDCWYGNAWRGFTDSETGKIVVRIGATIHVGAYGTQPGGQYTGVITMNVTYVDQ